MGQARGLVMDNTDEFEPQLSKDQTQDLEINAIRGEAVAYHNLGLDAKASQVLEFAEGTPAYRYKSSFWKPLVGRDVLNSMIRVPRYGRRKAEKLAYAIEDICAHNEDPFTLLLVREARLRSLLQAEKYKAAQHLFEQERDRLPSLPYVGSLHRALLLKSGALLAWKLGDRQAWEHRIRETLQLMRRAGLDHQIREVHRLYGAAIQSVLEE